jgi:aspartate beta-hydroxylase
MRDEATLFKAGIAALQAGNAVEARATFQSAIDTGVASAKIWMGLALAGITDGEVDEASAALDRVLELEPHNIRALIMKGDILMGRDEVQAAPAYYGLALRVAAPLSSIPAQIEADLERVAGIQAQLAQRFETHLFQQLNNAGYRRTSASPRFNASLDMLLGKIERPDLQQVFPQAPHAYFMPDMPYHAFAPEGQLPWLRDLEAHTDIIEAELNALLANRADTFAPYIHDGLDRPQHAQTTLANSDTWTSSYLWKDGTAVPEVMAACPQTTELMRALPLTGINGFSPSVLFSKLKAGGHIESHSGMINTRLICHLPLSVPSDCALRVGAETRTVERGRAWAFDDSVNHEAWNRSDCDRIILLFDVWRPELSEDEQHCVRTLLEAVHNYQSPTIK